MSFWPKHILHANSSTKSKSVSFIIVKFCEICGRGYHCGDVVIASYNHTHHPLCLVEVVRNNNKCLICGELFCLD